MSEKQDSEKKYSKWHNLILHLHPKFINEKALDFTLTFGLGGMAALLFVLLALTGMLLRFSYVPTPDAAYDSILHIKNNILFGNLIRNIHHWSATLLILVSFLHMLRVLLTGAYTNKRKSNWIIGVVMLILVLFSGFSGYLLPWDQLSYWAVTVVTGMLLYIPLVGEYINEGIVQGSEVGASTLLLFYTMHTGILPLAMVILMSFHFWKVRKAGGVVIPETTDEKPRKLPVIPNLVLKEFSVALILIAIILLLSILFEAPFGDPADPSITPNPTKAPWYFMGFQELILHFHPIVSVVITPVLITFSLFYLPYIKNNKPTEGIWFLSETGKSLAKKTAVVSTFLTIIYILLDEFVFIQLSIFKFGILNFMLLIGFIYTGAIFIKRKFNLSRSEVIQTIAIYLLTGFIVLTIIGIFFRGEGMQLTFFFI